MDGPDSPDPFKLTFLQETQELDLEGRAHLSDLIQKDRSLVGKLEPAYLGTYRMGKCTLFMAKELAFQEFHRYGGTVHGDERPVLASTFIMQCMGYKLFPCTGFAGNQDRTVRYGNFFHQLKDLPHCHAGAHYAFKTVDVLQFLPE